MLNQNGSVGGCKKPNSQPLVSTTVQALAIGIRVSGARLPAAKYLTEIQENKQGVKGC
ncbi:hypothetical protein Xvie_04087 [Xenorhabdus vietnamensis]|uniref:Uncharacterized protein n=2 Tax=Xenorhabdus vietnamensis TaxID=351656 RepID=A0A1Y2S8X3_9GAMM|nr:hypothetical protein Xvie_04087 [Xenorhabdus vietnamensis]